MNPVEATLYCPNLSCQAGNSEANQFCQNCGTFLPKRYLWALGQGANLLSVGALLNDRYRVKAPQILLDTKPGLLPDFPEEPSQDMLPYLHLVAHRPHVPEVYGVLPQASQGSLLLLEQIPLQIPSSLGELLPTLQSVWSEAGAMRQLHWLWQIAQLWQPCCGERVASSLLTPNLIRVEGGLVRLLALKPDGADPPSLIHLGQSWQPLVTAIQPAIYDFVDRLCQALIQGQVYTSEHLLAYLDAGLRYIGQHQVYQVEVATLSDRGPTRKRNEDACHPPSGTTFSKTWGKTHANPTTHQPEMHSLPITYPISDAAWAIVCDGIGGHQGGDVASNATVTAIQGQLENLLLKTDAWNAASLVTYLQNAAYLANDRISQQNDQDQKTDFQRMGTTLLTIFIQAHELYLTHIGDSRAYRITSLGCHQMMLDDDVASREARLGYSLYRQAGQHQSAGVLVQAIGTNSSSLLHPTVQRFMLDEDCVWLLCSDGLSDNDLVDTCWQSEILPLLTGNVTLSDVAERLVMIANYQNGHDNVTVALLHIHIQPAHEIPPLPKSLIEGFLAAPATQSPTTKTPSRPPAISYLKTQVAASPKPKSQPWGWLLLAVGFLAGGAYFLAPLVKTWIISRSGNAPTLSSDPTPTRSLPSQINPTIPLSSPLDPGMVDISTILQTTSDIVLLPQIQPNSPISEPANTDLPVQAIPSGSTLKVLRKQQIAPQEGNWLQLEVCAVNTSSNPQTLTSVKGYKGWSRENQLIDKVILWPKANQPDRDPCR